MQIVTSEQMKQIEKNALQDHLSYERLMENAGAAAASVIRRTLDVEGLYATLFCGAGNNGGDGFVVARKLCEAGANVAVVLTDGKPRTEQATTMLTLLGQMEVTVCAYGENPQYLAERLAETDLLVDAIYGTGFHGALDERHRDICRLLNGVDVTTFALDLPSGLNTDTGAADPGAVRADVTIVFDSLKPAACMPRAERHCGRVVLADIGIPAKARAELKSAYTLVDGEYVFAKLLPRPRESHKGSYGRLLNIAGSQQFMGAAAISTLAAMRSGAGYVTLASTKEVCRTAFPLLQEAVMLPLRQTPQGDLSTASLDRLLEEVQRSDAVLMGSGLGRSDEAYQIVMAVLKKARCPVILDADGINAVARNINILKEIDCPLILTPHIGELSRLTTQPIAQLKEDALPAGLHFACDCRATVVLKDAYTHTVTPEGHVYINTTGNAGLAKAGSGDVLAGIIGALAAQGHAPADAAACGVWLHGSAGDLAAQEYSQYGMLARDVIEMLGQVFRENAR